MNPVGRLLQRNQEILARGARTLWINLPEGYSPGADLASNSEYFFQDYSAFVNAGGASERRTFGDFPASAAFEYLVLNLPKSKARLAMMVECLASGMAQQGRLWLAGENRAGIRSAARVLESKFEQVEILDKARHCALFEARRAKVNGEFEPGDFLTRWSPDLGGFKLEVHSLPGVFAHGRLDEGTALLIESLETLPAPGRILDIACGCGILGAVLKVLNPDSELVLTDTDALALSSARETLVANQLRAVVVGSDGFSEVSGHFDLIVSNPPFHQGFATKHSHGINMLNPVRNFLRPGGQLLLVVNRHLPYQKWLDQAFGSHEILAENPRYQVLQACKPRTANRPAR
ncbi:MAG: class I SAM-dependent methyltransferase [Xanthomonadales bacterium]|nr:class I SAM-dependent methyltransferase [Xanthomonadales bacterium]